MSNFDATEDSEVWHVRLPNGDVRVMTVDQLDAAFQAGTIHADTMVLAEDATSWQRLGEVAGLDEAPTDDVAAPVNPSSAVFYEQTTAVYEQQVAFVQAQRAQRSEIPPPAAVPSFVLPPAQQSAYGNGLNSMRPVVSEISDFELEPVQFRSSKKRGVVVAIAALMVLGGAAFAVTKFGLPQESGAATASIAQAASPVASPAPSPAANPNVMASATDTQPAAKPAMDLSALSAPPRGLSEEQRKALLDIDKAREAKHKTKSHASGGSSPHHPHKAEASPFHKGGAPGDPLNSAL